MLVLSRKVGQTIRLGSEVRLRVLGVTRGRVSLGFDAAKDLRIVREELLRAVEAENRRAALSGPEGAARLDALWRNDGRDGEP